MCSLSWTCFPVDGSSDDLDHPIKQCFGDTQLVAKHNLISVNSINWGRILVQVAHFFYTYFQLCEEIGSPVEVVVPTGACGNITGVWSLHCCLLEALWYTHCISLLYHVSPFIYILFILLPLLLHPLLLFLLLWKGAEMGRVSGHGKEELRWMGSNPAVAVWCQESHQVTH